MLFSVPHNTPKGEKQMRTFITAITMIVVAFTGTAFGGTLRFDSPNTKTDYLTTGSHLGIAGDGFLNQTYAVINADRSLSRYLQATKLQDLTNPNAHVYYDLASMARLSNGNAGFADKYWAMYNNGVDEVNFLTNNVTNYHHNANVNYKAVAGDVFASWAYLAREDGGIDIVDRINGNGKLAATQALSGHTFIDLSEYATRADSFYGLTDTAVYQLKWGGGPNLTIDKTLATFAAGTYISIAGHSGVNDRGILARADGGIDEFDTTGISSYFNSTDVFPYLGTYGGRHVTTTALPFEFGNYYAATIPEPGSVLLLLFGTAILVLVPMRRRNI
jgi:hypothetical protein